MEEEEAMEMRGIVHMTARILEPRTPPAVSFETFPFELS